MIARLALSVVVSLTALVGPSSTPVAAVCDSDASCAALGGVPGYGIAPSDGPVFVAADHADPAVWECLRELGYAGNPLDGIEAMYVPASDLTDCTSQPA